VQSRRDNNLAQRFPEIVAAARGIGDLVLDGELVALRDGRLDFWPWPSRLAPAPQQE
jgi:ATP-dependent DNA ligase